ncbi:MAG: enoyl-CoA hydratase [Actinomycetota bacterium]|nr:enoyl-CoA hydratase [Actinomycetota bacterium]
MDDAVREYSTIRYEREDRVVIVTLARPDRRNAISPAMQAELGDAFVRADDDRRVHVVVLRGDGPSFCSGYDLHASGYEAFAVDPEHGRGTSAAIDDDLWRIEQGQRRLLSIFDLHKPVIAQVHGYCVAGGTDLALMCDLVLASEDALIGFPPVRSMGSPPHHLWTYLLGPQWAKRMLLTGDLLTGIDAARLGLVLDAVPPDELDDEVMALARRIALVDHHLLAANKRQVNLALELMGARTMQRLAAEIDVRGHQARAMREFGRVAAEDGMSAAVKARDEPFGDPVIKVRHAGG